MPEKISDKKSGNDFEENDSGLTESPRDKQIALIQAINQKIREQGWKPLRFALPVEGGEGRGVSFGQGNVKFQEVKEGSE